ncbi:MAG: hypothetical protein J6T38_05400 [Bacteroidaceae bacterium]|nr:hypothetical protein [Bacteroidaceae bacterium]
MKKLILSMWLLMLSMAVAAQTFVIKDKNGNKITYDVSKIEQITFQQDPPAFTVYEVKDEVQRPEEPGQTPEEPSEPVVETTTFVFAEVASFAGDPDFLFAHPDTVYVGADGQDFAFQLRANVDYNYKSSAGWLQYGDAIAFTDSLRFNAGMNPLFTERTAYIAFASTDGQMTDTLWVVQAGKTDSHYISIDWSSTTLDKFNEESGEAQLTFAGDVPEMGEYDVVLLPKDDSYVIRLINGVQQAEGSKTVTLSTRQGLMGNLFKGRKFTLATEAGAQRRVASLEYDESPVYLPTKVEVFTGDEYVEIYNVDKLSASGRRKAPIGYENEFFSWEYNQNGAVLWESGLQSLSWDKLNFSLGLKGLFSFDFGDIPFEKVRMGDLQHLKIALEGGFDMEMVLKYLVSSSVEWKKEWTLKEDVFQAKYTFMVGTVPVYITVGADLMAEVSLGASGEASITSGIKASNTVTYGVEWDAKDNSVSKIAECEKNLEMVGPNVDIKAHAEARATVYPQIEIGIYKVLCPTISPQPYIKAEADGRLVDNQYVAWNAGVSTGVDLGLGLSLDLFFWEWQLADIDPINVFDIPLVSLPDEIKLLNEPEEEVLINGKREVKYHVTNKINLTGKTYNAPGVLVHFEAEGGELEDEYGYTDKDGNVSAFFTLNDLKGGKVKAEVVLGAEGEEPEEGTAVDEEDGIKADDWTALAIDHRLTPSPASQEIEKDATAAIIYKLERYTSKTGEWTGFGGQTVQFEATGGTVAPTSAVTAQDGTVAITFTPEDEATEGKVTGSASGKDPDPWGKVSSATIKIKSDEGGDDLVIVDEGLKKAAKQKPNVYVVENKKTEEIQTREYKPQYSEWNKDQDAVSFSLEDADDEGGTLGMIWGFIPLTMTDVVLSLTGEQFANTPGAKFGFDVYDGIQLSGDFMSMTDHTEGNIQPQSKILLRKVSSASAALRRAPGEEEEYTGEYELLFYLVFKNRAYNPETQQMEDGDEYEVYGKGTMKMHVPTITSFQVKTEKDWVKVGESTKVNLQEYYEEEATWDWDDVEIKAQATNYEDARNGVDDGFFTWDATTQTLTSVKSNNNKGVYVRLGLKSNPSVQTTLTVATGEGWNYTMIKPSREEHTYTGYGYMSFSFDFAPKASENEKFDYNSLEIDPETNPNGYFSIPMTYAAQGWPLYVNSDTPAGEYTVRFWIKNNHAVSCTVKVIAYPEE